MKRVLQPTALAIALVAMTYSAANADGVQIVRVEEEWSLYVGEPSLNTNGPQVSMAMSPKSDLLGHFFMFYINYRTDPDYLPGGAQVQLMYGDEVLLSKDNPNDSLLDQNEETLHWTQVMEMKNGAVEFEIKDGTSKSWGGFGGLGHLKTSVTTGQTNLNSYNPAVSLTQSGVGYAGNRVVSLVLQRISWFTSDGHRYDLHAPIDIDSDLDPWD
ncbi:MAG: hypothetical protein KDB27_14295 [Planctomycetales bacterium]|nr:hypothetical protein [Planctomycetales bacterium]